MDIMASQTPKALHKNQMIYDQKSIPLTSPPEASA
jgi:hypothetical protein